MKKKHLIINSLAIIFISFLTQGCGAYRGGSGEIKLQTISLIDRNGITETINNPERIKQYQSVNFIYPQSYQKVIRIYTRDKAGNIPSFLHSYHENGQSKQYLEVINSRAYGAYREWHPNGALRLQSWVIGGEADLSDAAEKSWIFDGHAYAWDEDGNILADICYEKGRLQDYSVYYHPNGSVWRQIPYSDGQINGTVEVFLEDGTPFQKSEYVNNKLHGSTCRYWPSKRVALEEKYEEDRLEHGRYYDQNGDSVSEVNQGNGYKAVFGKNSLAEMHEFRNGLPEGEVKIFGTDQKLIRRYHVKNGLKHGEEIEYFELPHLRHIPKILVSWYEGKVQGITKSWYDNGVQESNREMSNNAKNGIATAWYRNGNLMLIEDYEQDKLLKGEYFRNGDKFPISSVKKGNGTATLFDADGNFVRKVFYDNGIPTGTN